MWKEILVSSPDEMFNKARMVMRCMDANYDTSIGIERTKRYLTNKSDAHCYLYDDGIRMAIISFKYTPSLKQYRVPFCGFCDGNYGLIQDDEWGWINELPDKNVEWMRHLVWQKIYNLGKAMNVDNFYAFVPKKMNRDPRINAVWGNTDSVCSDVIITEKKKQWLWDWNINNIKQEVIDFNANINS